MITTFKKGTFPFDNKINELLKDCETVLDIGCGKAYYYVNANIQDKRIVGIDLDIPALEEMKKKFPRLHFIIMDIRDMNKYLFKKSFDAVLMIDVLEHLDKKVSLKVLGMAEKIGRKVILIFTPKGFVHWGESGTLQEHKCGYEIDELEGMGYEVINLPQYHTTGDSAIFAYKIL